MLVAALVAAAFFYKRYGEEVEERSSFAGLLILAANGLAIALLTLDANDYFEQRKALASGREALGSLGNGKALTLTALWTIYGVGTLFVGLTRRLKPLRFLALLLLAGATVKVFVVDLRYYDASWHTLIANQTFAAFALVVLGLGILALGKLFSGPSRHGGGGGAPVVAGDPSGSGLEWPTSTPAPRTPTCRQVPDSIGSSTPNGRALSNGGSFGASHLECD